MVISEGYFSELEYPQRALPLYETILLFFKDDIETVLEREPLSREEVCQVEVCADDPLLLSTLPVDGDGRTYGFFPLAVDGDEVSLRDRDLGRLLLTYHKVLFDELA